MAARIHLPNPPESEPVYLEPADEPGVQVHPVPIGGTVTVAGTIQTHEEAPDYASYSTLAFAGTATDAAQQLAGYDQNRTRVLLRVKGLAAARVWIGSQAQANAGEVGNPQGFPLDAGDSIELFSKQPIWAVSDLAHPSIVCVLVERRQQ